MDPQELLEHADFVHTLARRLVSDVNHAADIEQQTWLAAIENPPTADKPAKLWLSKVAKNFVRVWNRSEARRKKRERRFAAKPTSSPYEVLEKEEIRSELIKAVLDLSDPCRKAIIHRYYDGLMPREIALHLDIPVERVRTQLKRGLARLRHSLDARHGGREKWLAAMAPLAGVTLQGEAVAGTGGASFLQGTLFMSGKVKLALAVSLTLLVTLSMVYIGSNLFAFRSDDPRQPDLTLVSSQASTPAETVGKTLMRLPEKAELPPSLESIRVTGRVCGRTDDRGIARATVSAALIPYDEQVGKMDGQTDDQGYFTFDVPHVEGAEPTDVYLSVTADGFLGMTTSLPIRRIGGHMKCGKLRLDNDEEHLIRITDLYGKPVSRAVVRIMKEYEESSIITKTSDEEGEVRISDRELIDRSASTNASRRLSVALIQAAGMSDHVILLVDWNQAGPISIQLHDAQNWEGHVIDKETRTTIENARVGLNIYNGDWASALKTCIGREKLTTCTDESGYFTIPKLTVEGGRADSYGFDCYAPGYRVLSSQYNDLFIDDRFPSKLLLERYKDSFKDPLCRAMDSVTSQPLQGFKIQRQPGYHSIGDATTNASGEFHAHDISRSDLTEGFRMWRFATRVAPPHDKRAFHGIVDPSFRDDDGIWEIPFKPLLLEQLTVGVRDETGSPIECAQVYISQKLDGEGGYYCDRSTPLTDEQGLSRADLWLIKPVLLRFKGINHPSYSFSGVIELSVPLSEDTPSFEGVEIDIEAQTIWFTMKRGILMQNIRVVNQNGEPVPNAEVIGNITLIDTREEAPSIWKRTDANGYCDMALPPFESGILCVRRRPDSAVNIDYDMVLNREGVTLYCHDEPPLEKSVQGIVHDEDGKPLGNIMLRLYEEASVRRGGKIDKDLRSIFIEDDGRFNIPASPDRTYRLMVFTHMWSSHWSLVKEIPALTAGSYQKIELSTRERTGIALRFESFYKAMRKKYSPGEDISNSFDYSFDYDAWLQTDEGQIVDGVEISKGDFDAYIDFIPPGLKNARVVMHAKSGEQYISPLIDIEAGKYVRLAD